MALVKVGQSSGDYTVVCHRQKTIDTDYQCLGVAPAMAGNRLGETCPDDPSRSEEARKHLSYCLHCYEKGQSDPAAPRTDLKGMMPVMLRLSRFQVHH